MNTSKVLTIAGAALAAVLFLATLAGGGLFVAYRAQLAQNEEPVRTDQRPREELVIDLPEDADKWALTVIYEGTKEGFSARDNALRATFAASPRIRSMTVQCHQNTYYSDHPMWTEKYEKTVGGPLPLVMLQEPGGVVVYKASGDNIPYHPDQMADELQYAVEATSVPHDVRYYPDQQTTRFSATAVPLDDASRRSTVPDCRPYCPPALRPNAPSGIPDRRPQFGGPLRPSSGSTVWVVVGVLLVGSVVAAAVLAVLVGLAIVAAARR